METMRNQTTCRFNPQKGYAIANDSAENLSLQINKLTACVEKNRILFTDTFRVVCL